MVMEFLCPQGHKIRCGEKRAGKAAKCPRCGVRFIIPQPWEIENSESGDWATAPVEVSGVPGSNGPKQDQIEFLCPNGHRIWASVQLQGRPGQCPECGSKFHIPTSDDYEQAESALADPSSLVSPEESAVNLDELDPFNRGSSDIRPLDRGEALKTNTPAGESPGDASARQGLPDILAELIEQAAEQVTVSIHTTDGQVYRTSQILPGLCSAQMLAFVVTANEQEDEQEDEQQQRVVIVPFSTMIRLEVQGLDELSKEFTR